MFGFSCSSFSGNSRFGYTRLVSLFDLTKLTDSIHYFLDKSSSKKKEILFLPKSFIFFLHTLVRVILVAETFPQNCGVGELHTTVRTLKTVDERLQLPSEVSGWIVTVKLTWWRVVVVTQCTSEVRPGEGLHSPSVQRLKWQSRRIDNGLVSLHSPFDVFSFGHFLSRVLRQQRERRF